mmetsp:Transcript_46494/g.91488  ORF Transcript_46494/g.91488 Transcript_46494/m.91488 type:complete len:301 (-) Transcript_46494:141-1043(-)
MFFSRIAKTCAVDGCAHGRVNRGYCLDHQDLLERQPKALKTVKMPERFMVNTNPGCQDLNSSLTRLSVDIDDSFAHFEPLRNSFVDRFRNDSNQKGDSADWATHSQNMQQATEPVELFGRNTHTLSKRIKDGVDEYLQGVVVQGKIVGRGVFKPALLSDVRTGLAFRTDFAPLAIAHMRMYLTDWERVCSTVSQLLPAALPALPFNTPFNFNQLRVTCCCRNGEYVILVASDFEQHSRKRNFRCSFKVCHQGVFQPEHVKRTTITGYELKPCEAASSEILLAVSTVRALVCQAHPRHLLV